MADSPFSAFGDKSAPKPVVYPWLKPLLKPATALGTEGIGALSQSGKDLQSQWDLGTPRQTSLMGEQEGVLRNLLQRQLNYDPNAALGDIGRTAFSFIDPNVVSPLAKFDVNYDRVNRMAAGLNPAAVDSTAQRLRDARIASGRYYDVAKNVYNQLPSLYGQAYNQGQAANELAGSYIPRIMSGYRDIDLSGQVPANIRANNAITGANILGALSQGAKGATYGFQQPRNVWDTLGELDSSLWNRMGEGINMASSLYGGSLGGLMGGGGGAGGGGGGGL